MQATKPIPGSALAGNVIPAHQIHFAKPSEKKATPIVVSKPSEHPPLTKGEAGGVLYHQPQVTLIKEGDTVHAIEVICTCGEVIRLDCKYGD